MDVLAERDRAGFPDWRTGYVARFAVAAALSDDRNTCKPVAEQPGLPHQVCLGHVAEEGVPPAGRD